MIYWIALGIYIILLLVMLGVTLWMLAYFLPAIFFGAIFVPSSDERVEKMLELGKVKKGEKAVDLGSGDGKVVIEVARKGATAVGIEINPLLVKKSRKRIYQFGLENKAKIIRGSLWRQDLSKYNVVFVYGMTYMMGRLEKKLLRELKPGTRVVSNAFTFPNWKEKVEKNHVRLYIKKAS